MQIVINKLPELLTWHDTLTIAVIIFAITQFMETTPLRRYIFYLGWLRTITVVLVALPIILIIITNIFLPSLFPAILSISELKYCYNFVYSFPRFLPSA